MTTLPLVFDAPRRGMPPDATSPTSTRRPPRGGRRARPAGVPRRPARPPLLRPLRERPGRDDRPARRRCASRSAAPCCRRCSPRSARSETDDGHDPQDAVAPARRRAGRERADALPGPRRLRERITVCVSSQAGCGMACPFCATGQGGLTRNLSTAEIVEQVRVAAPAAAARRARRRPRRLSNVVFMGMGEPLANYNRVDRRAAPPHRPRPGRVRPVAPLGHRLDRRARARRSASSPTTSSASRWPCRCTPPTTSCATPSCRSTPAGRSAEVLAAADAYAARTGRRYSIEYAMIRDVNDQAWRAELLGDLLAPRLAHVNLIPLNPTPGSQWDASPKPVEREFVRRLEARGVVRDRPRHPRARDRRRLRPAGRRRPDRSGPTSS